MKKIIFIALFLMMSLSLGGCSDILATHRTVEKMNETSLKDYYEADFTNLDGRTVIKIKKDNSDGNFDISASLSDGQITVKYMDSLNNEVMIATIKKGENIDNEYGYITSNASGYLIIETTVISSGTIKILWNKIL